MNKDHIFITFQECHTPFDEERLGVHNQFLSSVYLNGYLIHNAYPDHTVEILASYMVKALLWVLYCMYAKCRMTHTAEMSIQH